MQRPGIRQVVSGGASRARQLTPRQRTRHKYEAELDHWRTELQHLHQWFVDGTTDWWGIRPPSSEQKVTRSDIWSVNAILTMHQMRPSYLEELQIAADAFVGERVLEVGCGPLAPILQFTGCDRHGVDPLTGQYVTAGWPLYALDVTVVTAGAERMPYPDGWFDSVISVNALDHVDDFQAMAREVQRVLRPGGRLMFDVEYHEPTVTEPVELSDEVVCAAFGDIRLSKVRELDARDLFAGLVERFHLSDDVLPPLGSGERYACWHGVRR
jgi:SAM-dependent methyltransferase